MAFFFPQNWPPFLSKGFRKKLSNLKIKSSMLSYTQAILRLTYYLQTSVPEQHKGLEQSLAPTKLAPAQPNKG